MATPKAPTTKKVAKPKAPAKARAPRKTKAPKEAEETVKAAQTEEAPAVAKASQEAGSFDGRYIYAVGRRKTAVAQVRLYTVSGEKAFVVNKKTALSYFGTEALASVALLPMKAIGKENDFSISVLVRGGGLNGQADAIKLGVARALIEHDAGFRSVLKAQGFLTRDARAVERKKPGLKKARRAPQWAKR